MGLPAGETRPKPAQATPAGGCLTLNPEGMWTFVLETTGGGTHRQPSRLTLKPNASRKGALKAHDTVGVQLPRSAGALQRLRLRCVRRASHHCPLPSLTPSYNDHVYETL
jgi:hypothetical protein